MKRKTRSSSRWVMLLLVVLALLFTACSTGGEEVVAPTVDTAALDAAQEAAEAAQATAEAAQAALEAAAEGDEAAQATLEAELAAAQAALEDAEGALSDAEAEAAAAMDAQATAEAELAAVPVDIELWAQATVTEAGPPPGDWIAYQIIKDELNINLTYTIIPTGADGEAKLNAAAAANDLPDLFQMVSTSNDVRGALFRFADLGLVAPVEDLMPLMPQRTELHYNDPLADRSGDIRRPPIWSARTAAAPQTGRSGHPQRLVGRPRPGGPHHYRRNLCYCGRLHRTRPRWQRPE